jgi:hypothetical protein
MKACNISTLEKSEQARTVNEQKAEREPNANEQNSTLVLFAVRVRSGGK